MDHYRTLVDLRRLTRTLRFLLLTGALAFVLMYLVVALSRLFYPFDLEFMEGGLLHQVRRVISGEGLYVPPSLGYTAFPYPPLYFYAAAAVATLTRLGFAPLRIISFVASLGSLVLIYRFVRRETESAFCGILSASLFAATFLIGGASFDLARVDSLFLCLLLAGVYVLRKSSSRPSACAAGLLMGLSFLTKQTALVVGLSLGLQSLLPGKRRGRVLFTLVFFGVIGASTFLMNALSSGWYSFYCFQQFRHHDLVRDQILGFWTADVMRPLGIAVALTLVYLYYLTVSGQRDELAFSGLMLAGMIAAAWLSRLHRGGYDNVLLPAHAALSIHFGLGVNVLLKHMPAWGAGAEKSSLIEPPVYALCLIQFASLLYNPMSQIPTVADRAAGEQIVQRLRAIDGEVLVPLHGYLACLAGKRTCPELLLLKETLESTDDKTSAQLESEIRNTIRDGRFKAIVLDSDKWRFMDEVQNHYSYAGPLFSDDSVFWTRTGVRTRPQELYLFRDSAGP